jgi:hypothetical protein
MLVKIFVPLVIGASIAAIGPTLACKGSKTLFSDNFSFVDAGWDAGDAAIDKGSMTITPKPDSGYSVLYVGDVFPKADICVDIAIPQARNTKDEYLSAGILFLAEGYDASHYYWHSPGGFVGVSRLANGKWTNPVPPRQFAFNRQVGSTNSLRVTVGGGRGTIYINDKKIVDFRAQESEGAEYFGLRADSEQKASTPWKFSNVKITEGTQ